MLRLLVLVSVCCATSVALAQEKRPAPAPQPRFSAEANELLAELSGAYRLNNREQAGGQFRGDVFARLAKSKDPNVQALAELGPALGRGFEGTYQAGKAVRTELEDRAAHPERIVKDLARKAIKRKLLTPSEAEDLITPLEMLEALPGDKLIQKANAEWAMRVVSNSLANTGKRRAEVLAQRSDKRPAAKLSVLIATHGQRGVMLIQNMTGKTLHNCLLLTHLEPDLERVKRAKESDDLGTGLLFGLSGFSEKATKTSVEQVKLRTHYLQQEKGGLLFVPELKPKEQMVADLGPADLFAFSKLAAVSLWSDEAQVVREKAANWDQLMNPAQPKAEEGFPGFGRLGTTPSNGAPGFNVTPGARPPDTFQGPPGSMPGSNVQGDKAGASRNSKQPSTGKPRTTKPRP